MQSSLQFVLTCQSWLESLVKRECEKLSLNDIRGQDRLVKCQWSEKQMYELLLWSRFANRVYLSLWEAKITDFDTLFDTLSAIDWSLYLTGKERIIIEAASTKSELASIPTIQSVSQKAIFSKLRTPNTTSGIEVHILILLIEDTANILVDITGDPLHKRWYRQESWEAPIKESLAAALVAFSGWRYKESLLDPFCGSGTIAIEAALIARNIAPGLTRHFRLESLPFYDASLFQSVQAEASKKSYPSGQYRIYANDIDPTVLEKAKNNAIRAGVGEDITFWVDDFLETSDISGTLVTNPPYGERLKQDNLHEIYTKIVHTVSKNGGGFITSYPVDVRHGLANKKLLNGGEECRFWYKKS